MEEDIFKKAYDWALTYQFSEVEIDYASRLALKMLDDSCNMSHEERKVFFYVYDAITDREDIKLEDEVNQLIRLARNRKTIFSKPEFTPIVHACKMEVMQSTEKKYMKRFKKLVRENLGLLDGNEN
ncbi:MAG: hypothetical protein U9R50_08190 [Campylobacterota bacterium]|nr:hypothetical protein [Campylobacterota bacterium]